MSQPETRNPTFRAFLQAVKEHWIALMSGGVITVALGVFERFSGKNVPLWVYGFILIFFTFLACYLAWRDAEKARTQINVQDQKRQFLAERLQSLLNEAGSFEYGIVSLSTLEGMGKLSRADAYHERVKNFIKQHYGSETASRYDKERSNLLESLLADCYKEKDDTKPDISGAIERIIEKKILPQKDQGIAGFDYYFTLRFWLRNTGARGNFHDFVLSIFIDDKTYTGEMLPLSGYCLLKEIPAQCGAHTELQRAEEKLANFDALTPLERNSTRSGWLRFVVRNVQWNMTDESANHISHLELTVTDGGGGQWTLTDKPPWSHENPKLEVRVCNNRS
jgi:hypothetical protein